MGSDDHHFYLCNIIFFVCVMFSIISDQLRIIVSQSSITGIIPFIHQFDFIFSSSFTIQFLSPCLQICVPFIRMDLTLDANNNSNFSTPPQTAASKALDDYLEELGDCNGEFTEGKQMLALI